MSEVLAQLEKKGGGNIKSVFVGHVNNSDSFAMTCSNDGNIGVHEYSGGTANGYTWTGSFPSSSGANIHAKSVNGGKYSYMVQNNRTVISSGVVTVGANEEIASFTGIGKLLLICEI